jgi:primosomal protein N' (replication factor Y)
MDSIAKVRTQGKSALFLLPEISLSAQVMDILKARFGDEVAVLHSALTPGQWFDEWQRIRRGDAKVIVGARSAVFAPAQNLGLIIIDEEHDGSYKQDTNPRYNARDVALRRAQDLKAVCILGSATPSIESMYHASTGKYALLKLTKRIGISTLPPVITVDLKDVIKPSDPTVSVMPAHLRGILSPALSRAIELRLERKEQAILFLNRRGFAKFLLCRDCGFTFHRESNSLQCHHCGYFRPAPEQCPKCTGTTLRSFGIGTEKVQEAVNTQFDGVRTLRMDRDTVTRKGAHGEILRSFKNRDADVLIGTQMVAKGLDFPNVTLVGVINADTALNMPDFRASERAFQLIMQVAGRAGRGETKGEVFVQTFNPDHESIKLASKHDYDSFYKFEIENRRELCYPTFSLLGNIIISNEILDKTVEIANLLARKLTKMVEKAPKDCRVDILGPVACPLERLRNKYRYHIVVRTPNRTALLRIMKIAVDSISTTDRASIAVDIDPVTML